MPSGTYFYDERGRRCFRPAVPSIPKLEDVIDLLRDAEREIGEFDRRLSQSGAIGSVGRLFARLDAVHSSGAEGTTTTFTDLMEYQSIPGVVADGSDAESVASVSASFDAEIDGSDPVRTVLSIHRRLFERHPSRFKSEGAGSFKTSVNAVQDPEEPFGFFHYTHPDQLADVLEDWRGFTMEKDPRVPETIRQVCSHWMFENIHPVADGNGRIGRLLVPLVMKWKGATENGCVFFGEAVHENKELYVDGLKSVRKTDDTTGYCRIVLGMISDTARSNMDRLDRIQALASEWESIAAGQRSDSLVHRMLPWMLTKPVFNVLDAARELGTTFVTANKAVAFLVSEGVLSNPGGAARNRLFVADGVLDIFDRFRRPSPTSGYGS